MREVKCKKCGEYDYEKDFSYDGLCPMCQDAEFLDESTEYDCEV